MNQRLVFRPTDNESIFLEEANISWSEFCHENIERKRSELTGENKDRKRENLRAMSTNLMIFFVGVMCLGLSYVVINYVIFIILNIAALFCMVIGMGLLIQEWLRIRTKELFGGGKIV